MRVASARLISSNVLDTGNVPLVIASGTLSGSFASAPVSVLHLYGWSATVSTSGVTGLASFQVCNDPGNNEFDPTNLTTWSDYPNIESAMSSSGGAQDITCWNMQQQMCHWIRFVWTHLAGTGSIDLTWTGKGASQ